MGAGMKLCSTAYLNYYITALFVCSGGDRLCLSLPAPIQQTYAGSSLLSFTRIMSARQSFAWRHGADLRRCPRRVIFARQPLRPAAPVYPGLLPCGEQGRLAKRRHHAPDGGLAAGVTCW